MLIDDGERSLEGASPEIRDDATLAKVIDQAFDYRGDVTLVLTGGGELVGYLFNRNADGSEPFVQVFEQSGGGPHRIPYARIRSIRFTGKDTAAGNSYAAWLRSREAAKAASSSPGA
ncbi:MAG TPA: hypothetical protein VGU22_03125 [Methylomirabilota bacterium]|jgi:hypothetical protein|nr:hypothetical protein [Methylomirabilota bacterium]